MATYNDIKMANETITTTDIKGKAYAEVNQRIKAFRMVYPEGFITTEIFSLEGGIVTMKAKVGFYLDNGEARILGTGTAQEKETSSFINKTSYIENCETSAIGRALGMAGFGIDTSVGSYEEVANAIKNQTKPMKYATKEACDYIKEHTTPEQLEKIMMQKNVHKLEELSDEQAMGICMKLNERMMKDGRLG